jgi:hypothetical protein
MGVFLHAIQARTTVNITPSRSIYNQDLISRDVKTDRAEFSRHAGTTVFRAKSIGLLELPSNWSLAWRLGGCWRHFRSFSGWLRTRHGPFSGRAWRLKRGFAFGARWVSPSSGTCVSQRAIEKSEIRTLRLRAITPGLRSPYSIEPPNGSVQGNVLPSGGPKRGAILLSVAPGIRP